MQTHVMFLDCPAYQDEDGSARCGLPAEVLYRYGSRSTGGLCESAKIRCPLGHWFNGTLQSLSWDEHPAAAATRAAGTARPVQRARG